MPQCKTALIIIYNILSTICRYLFFNFAKPLNVHFKNDCSQNEYLIIILS